MVQSLVQAAEFLMAYKAFPQLCETSNAVPRHGSISECWQCCAHYRMGAPQVEVTLQQVLCAAALCISVLTWSTALMHRPSANYCRPPSCIGSCTTTDLHAGLMQQPKRTAAKCWSAGVQAGHPVEWESIHTGRHCFCQRAALAVKQRGQVVPFGGQR